MMLLRERLGMLAFGAVVFGAGLYGANQWTLGKKDEVQGDMKFDQKKGPYLTKESSIAVYNDKASKYDALIGSEEAAAGIISQRKKLGANARGRVLEVGIGSGRNLEFYIPSQVTNITGIDHSEKMMEEARGKAFSIPVDFISGDAHQLTEIMKGEKFDTVVDTFGLCAYQDPLKVLQEMQQVCKPEGRILLLEHGKSKYSLMNYILDWRLTDHAKRWACIFNRDLEKIVSQSGLIVEDVESSHFSTNYLIFARPNPYFTSKDKANKNSL